MKLYVDELPWGYTCPFGSTCDGYWDYKHCPDHFETHEELKNGGMTACKMLKVLPDWKHSNTTAKKGNKKNNYDI